MKDIVNVSVVNFHPIWGKKERNLKRIEEYIECEALRGNHIIVFRNYVSPVTMMRIRMASDLDVGTTRKWSHVIRCSSGQPRKFQGHHQKESLK